MEGKSPRVTLTSFAWTNDTEYACIMGTGSRNIGVDIIAKTFLPFESL